MWILLMLNKTLINPLCSDSFFFPQGGEKLSSCYWCYRSSFILAILRIHEKIQTFTQHSDRTCNQRLCFLNKHKHLPDVVRWLANKDLLRNVSVFVKLPVNRSSQGLHLTLSATMKRILFMNIRTDHDEHIENKVKPGLICQKYFF
jgi:hypothetical protein